MSLLLCPNPEAVAIQWIFDRQDLLQTPSVLRSRWDANDERTEKAKALDKMVKVVDYLRV